MDTDLAFAWWSVGARIQQLSQEFLLQQFKLFAGVPDQSDIRQHFLGTILSQHTGQLMLLGFQSGEGSQHRTAKLMEGFVAHRGVTGDFTPGHSSVSTLHYCERGVKQLWRREMKGYSHSPPFADRRLQ